MRKAVQCILQSQDRARVVEGRAEREPTGSRVQGPPESTAAVEADSEALPSLFSRERKVSPAEFAAQAQKMHELYVEIGHLTTQVTGSKKTWSRP